jgi:hypothetical protein
MSNHYPDFAHSGSSDKAGYSPNQVNILEQDDDNSDNEFWKNELKSPIGQKDESITLS